MKSNTSAYFSSRNNSKCIDNGIVPALNIIIIFLLQGIFVVPAYSEEAFSNSTIIYKTAKDTTSPYPYIIKKHMTANTKKEKIPLVIELHDASRRSVDLFDLPMFVERLFSNSGHAYIYVKPKSSEIWQADKLDLLIQSLINDYPSLIDEKRIYIFGHSMGGMGAWVYCLEYGDKIAAMISIEGGFYRNGPKISDFDFKHFKFLPVWVFHNRDDKVVPVDTAISLVNAAKNAGGLPRFTIHESGGHSAQWRANLSKEHINWLFSQSR